MPVGPKRWFFDAWSLFYDLPWVQRAVYRPVQDAVVTRLRRGSARAVLDLGCGTGQLAARLRRELPGARVVGCDFSRGMLEHGRARDGGTAWVQGDAGRLPFRRAAFDVVVSTEAFHWFPDQPAALAEIRRVLRPGGRLVLALVNPRFALTGRLMRLASGAIGEPFYWPTAAEMRGRVRAAGFGAVRQARLFRLPGALLFPPVLTVATVPAGPGAPARAE
jgi:ubiquinone/menaquinone biosynthesis C-methylase UbiE